MATQHHRKKLAIGLEGRYDIRKSIIDKRSKNPASLTKCTQAIYESR
jgi:hypothetical protein